MKIRSIWFRYSETINLFTATVFSEGIPYFHVTFGAAETIADMIETLKPEDVFFRIPDNFVA